MVVGLYSEADKTKIMRGARRLENSKFKLVNICHDLTRKQRESEASLAREAEKRNEEDLTDDDRAKNLKWAVVGAKGEKRLIKTTAQPARGRGGRRGGRGRGRGMPMALSQPVAQNTDPEAGGENERSRRRPRSEEGETEGETEEDMDTRPPPQKR